MRIAFVFMTVLFLASCQCYQVVSGTIIDSETEQPVEKAKVIEMNKGESVQTDSTGRFEFNITAKKIFKCPDMELIVHGEGFKSRVLVLPSGTDKDVKLKKEK